MIEKLKKQKKKAAIAACAVIVAVLGAAIYIGAATHTDDGKQPMEQAESVKIERRTLMRSISATGSITSAESAQVTAPITNVAVDSVHVEVGDTVAAGDILCAFDVKDIEENLAQTRTSLEVTEARAQMELEAAERGLAETIENNRIQLDRMNADTEAALHAYNESLTKQKEAEESRNAAKANQDALAAHMGSLQSAADTVHAQMAGAQSEFQKAKEEILALVSTPVSGNGLALAPAEGFVGLEITDDLTDFGSAGDVFPGVEETSDTAGKINDCLDRMKAAGVQYTSASTEQAKVEAELEEAQQNYVAGAQTVGSLEAAYAQAEAAAEGKHEAYIQKQRGREDVERSNASSLAGKTDGVTAARLNARAGGSGERVQIQKYEKQLEDCRVHSPISGIVTALHIAEGDTYAGTPIATIEDIASYKITAQIDEYDISDIQVGQKVVVKTSATEERKLEGRVEAIAPRATFGAETAAASPVTYAVTVGIVTPCGDLKLDMTARLSVILENRENVLAAPYHALQTDEKGNCYVEVVAAKDVSENSSAESGENAESLQTKRIPVTKGIESDYYVEIISDEIAEGMTVLVPAIDNEESVEDMIRHQGPMGGF